ncbi:hypothetical protein BDZ91DRAFT_142339 [Kalaharituber pfeilii]|nr:hypothetical protein BDZ91DRAFT_142339 [Kalaharituber pfeilii]
MGREHYFPHCLLSSLQAIPLPAVLNARCPPSLSSLPTGVLATAVIANCACYLLFTLPAIPRFPYCLLFLLPTVFTIYYPYLQISHCPAHCSHCHSSVVFEHVHTS